MDNSIITDSILQAIANQLQEEGIVLGGYIKLDVLKEALVNNIEGLCYSSDL